MCFKQDKYHELIDIVLILTKGFGKTVCEFPISPFQRYVRQMCYRHGKVTPTLWQLDRHIWISWMYASAALRKLEIQVVKIGVT